MLSLVGSVPEAWGIYSWVCLSQPYDFRQIKPVRGQRWGEWWGGRKLGFGTALPYPCRPARPLLGFGMTMAHLSVGSCHALSESPWSWPNGKAPFSPFPSQAMSIGCCSPAGQTLMPGLSECAPPTLSPLEPFCAVLKTLCDRAAPALGCVQLVLCCVQLVLCCVVLLSCCTSKLFSGSSHVDSLPPFIKTGFQGRALYLLCGFMGTSMYFDEL